MAEAVEVELPHNLQSHDDLRVLQRPLRLSSKQRRDNYSESPCCVLCFGKDLGINSSQIQGFKYIFDFFKL